MKYSMIGLFILFGVYLLPQLLSAAENSPGGFAMNTEEWLASGLESEQTGRPEVVILAPQEFDEQRNSLVLDGQQLEIVYSGEEFMVGLLNKQEVLFIKQQ